MFRLYFSIFWNKPSTAHGDQHEGTLSMKLPLIILALCTILAGFVPVGNYITADGRTLKTEIDPVFSIAPVLLSVAAILLAMSFYKKESERPARFATTAGGFYTAAKRKFYIDELYLFVTKKIIFPLVGKPAAWFDRHVVDGLMNALASATASISAGIKGLQSGKVQAYALYFFGGIVALAVLFIYVWK
jgi:NADH-quinone oxidoreductase subunit L